MVKCLQTFGHAVYVSCLLLFSDDCGTISLQLLEWKKIRFVQQVTRFIVDLAWKIKVKSLLLIN